MNQGRGKRSAAETNGGPKRNRQARRFTSTLPTAAALLLLALIPVRSRAADPVANAEIAPHEGKYLITYDLHSQVPGFVDLLGSSDGGQTFDLVMEHVTGDVGEKRVFPGRGLRIVWDAAKDLGEDLDSLDVVVHPFYSFRRRAYQEENELLAVQTGAEYQEELRRERETYTQWILDNEARVEDLIREQAIKAQRLSGLVEHTRLYGLRASRTDDRERKKAEKEEEQRLKEIEDLSQALETIDREISVLREKIRQLKFERGRLE